MIERNSLLESEFMAMPPKDAGIIRQMIETASQIRSDTQRQGMPLNDQTPAGAGVVDGVGRKVLPLERALAACGLDEPRGLALLRYLAQDSAVEGVMRRGGVRLPIPLGRHRVKHLARRHERTGIFEDLGPRRSACNALTVMLS